uniref:uncharacterized protein LOC120330333 n=1 Tax=Styela clava TaxID=7725 RepID=UPI00193AA41E|nr:uncharacterized protein LOC120330333 [Styela clava]
MKILLLLLGCLAVANAALYQPSHCGYVTYNVGQFYRINYGCYSFRSYYCPAWFTTKYYSNVLKSYPGEKCTEDGFVEMTVDVFEAEVKKQLKEVADKIYLDMQQKYEDWDETATNQNTEAKKKHEDAIEEYAKQYLRITGLQEESEEMKETNKKAIENYNTKLDSLLEEAKKNYNDDMQKRYACVLEYHEKLVERSVTCFTTRLAKIAEYKEALEKRVTEYETKYKCVMEAIVKQRSEVFQKLIYRAHCSEDWNEAEVNAVLEAFKTKETQSYQTQLDEYTTKLTAAIAELVKSYACAYQCAYGGTLCFGRSQFYTNCRSIGKWWTYRITTQRSCFRFLTYKFQYRTIQYKQLKKCETDEVNITEQKFKEDLDTKAKTIIESMKKTYAEWFAQAEITNQKALESFKKIVDERHKCLITYYKANCLVKNNCITADNLTSLEEYQKSLDEQKKEAIAEYEKKLEERLSRASKAYTDMIDCHEQRINERIAKYVAQYASCLSTRKTKIENYEKCLSERFERRLKCITERLEKISQLRMEQYLKLLEFYMGKPLGNEAQALYDAYQAKTETELADIVTKIKGDWEKHLSDLKEHYACGFKCTYCVQLRELRIHYNYRCVLPTSSSYCFAYKQFCTYKSYRIVNYGGCFRYVRCV